MNVSESYAVAPGLEDHGDTPVNASWSIFGQYDIFEPPIDVQLDYYGVRSSTVHANYRFEVKRSGHLFIERVHTNMRSFTFMCRVWNDTSLEWSLPYTLQPLIVLNYGKLGEGGGGGEREGGVTMCPFK